MLSDDVGEIPDIEGYSRLREVARGGQSVVFRAHEETSGEEVALKVLVPGIFASRTAEPRFEREFQALKTLRHPNVVGARTCGQTSDGRNWISMDFVSGPRLDEWIREQRESGNPDPSRIESLKVFDAIARAVRYAHQRGVLHRDLKPANVRIDLDGAPKVLDFGIARIDLPGQEATSLITVSRQFLGTPGYASPEQVAGRTEDIDARTDIHALGLLLYELLVGRTPYAREGLAATLQAVENDPPPRPSKADPAVDSDLDAIVLCALAKSPSDRYQSVDALLSDLDRRQRGLPVSAHPPGALYELRKWIGRNRLLFGLAATLLVLLTSFGVTASALLSQERSIRAAKERLSDYLLGLLFSADPYRNADPLRTVDEIIAEADERLKAELADDPAEQARFLNLVGIHHRTAAHYDEAEEALSEALKLRRELFDDDHVDVAESLIELASLRIFVGGDGEEMLREGLAMHRRLVGDADPSILVGLGRLGQLLAGQGDLAAARPLLEEAFRIADSALGENHPSTILSIHHLSQLHFRAGDLSKARELQEQAQRLRIENNAPPLSISVGHGVFGDIALAENDIESAVREFSSARDITRAALGDEHEDVALVTSRLVFALARKGDSEEALSLATEAVETLSRTLPADHIRILTLRTDIGACHTHLGNLDRAGEELRSVAEETGSHVPRLASALVKLGFALMGLEEFAAAEETLELALHQQRRNQSLPESNLAGVLGDLGWLAGRRGDHQTAASRFSEASDLIHEDTDDPAYAFFLAQLAHHQVELGEVDAARDSQRAAKIALKALAQLEGNRTRDATATLLLENDRRLK